MLILVHYLVMVPLQGTSFESTSNSSDTMIAMVITASHLTGWVVCHSSVYTNASESTTTMSKSSFRCQRPSNSFLISLYYYSQVEQLIVFGVLPK